MNLNEIAEEKKLEPTARERLQDLNKQSKMELENSLLKENLTEYTALFERLKKEQNIFLEQAERKLESEREQNRKSLLDLNSSVKNLRDSSETLTEALESTMEGLKDDLRVECSVEIKNALQSNLNALQANVIEYDKNISALIRKTDEQMKQVNNKMQQHLYDFEDKKHKFFQFDGARNIFFWASQVVSFGTLGLLIYFLFFRV